MVSQDELYPLAAEVGERLRGRGLTLGLAESCTGGLIGSLITDVAGSSDYFMGSAVTYSNEAKERVLRVRHATLVEHGAVSAQTAEEMARGARRVFGTAVGASVTGIAGPGGGTAAKPTGLTYIHLSAPAAELGERHIFPADRIGNKRLAAEAVLRLLLRYLEEA